jgi:hypothetical protein
MAVVETEVFLRQSAEIWTDEERNAFVDFIARNPEAGDIIPGSGGVRKVRWRWDGGGKRGGVRIIYFYLRKNVPLYLLMIYRKSRQADLSPDAKEAVQNFAERLKRAYRSRMTGRREE